MKILIATCSKDARYSGPYLYGVLAASRHPAYAGLLSMEQESDLSRARSRAAEIFLGKKDIDALLFVDDDMGFGQTEFDRMAVALKNVGGVIGGLYQKRRPQGGLVYRPRPDREPGDVGLEHPQDRDMIEVEAVGTGFLGVDRATLTRVADRAPSCGDWRLVFHARHTTEGRYLSEDYGFCRDAAAAGATVWLHRGIRLKHIGACEYGI